MSWYPWRQVFDGNYNIFRNIPTVGSETATAARSTPIVLTAASTQVQTITGTWVRVF